MKRFPISIALCAALAFAACKETTTDPEPTPDPQQMSFKSGARYEYLSYSTDAETRQKVDPTERTRTLTLVQTNATVHGQSGVAVYIDSIFNVGGVLDVNDSVYLRQQSGTNNVFRYASLISELDFTGIGVVELGRDWRREAHLGATTAAWLTGREQDTIPYDPGISGVTVEGLEVAVTDSAVASSIEKVTVGTTEYETTKTTHKLILSITALVKVGPLPTAPIELKTVSLNRTIWVAPALGAVVREEREGTVVNAQLDVSGETRGITIPIPGSVLIMTKVLSTGG